MPGFPERFPVRDDDRRPRRYRVVAGTIRIALRTVYRGGLLEVSGEENIPASGPLLVVANHLSNLDPMMFGALFPRTLFAMAKRELFPNRAAAWMWAGCNVFPVDRGAADRRALRTALEILDRGGRLLLFVEGTRARSPGMKRAEPGVGFLLRRSRAAVLPVAVWGTEAALVRGRRLPRRVPLHVRYGVPFRPADDDPTMRNSQAASEAVAVRIAAMLPPEYRGVYGEAGSPAL